ncbi:MAG: protein kinase [Chloroflexi bacterium]|nr:protein kinase [Chloroflexota bacterium]
MSSDALIGTQIGEFTVQEVIGRGGMATVYRATQPLMRRDVALKVILMDDVADKNRDFSGRFASEAKLIASLEHPHVLPVYSYGFSGNVAYLAMRMLRGGSLEDLLHGEPLVLPQALDLFNQIAQGLAYAHSKGILHRDIKPSNILLDSDGHAYLTDFGLAKLIDADAGFTKSGQIMGTPVYMSPEQLKGEALDFRSDVYALGCILYEMLTGTPPFQPVDGDVIPVIFKHLQAQPDTPTSRSPLLPPSLDPVVLRALAKAPADRFHSVREMATAVQQAVGQLPTVSLPRPADTIINRTQPLVTTAAPGRRGLLAGIVALIVVVIAGVVLLMLAERSRQSQEVANVAATATAQVVERAVTSTAVAQQQADATQTALASIPRFSADQIIVGEEARLEDLMPGESEVALAQRSLGLNGFIAIMPCNVSSEYHAALTREIASFARESGLQSRVYDPDSDAYTQLTLLERAIAEDARGIILCPLDLELLGPTMEEIRRAGIPFVTQASNMGEYGGVQILTDNTLLGHKPGVYMGQMVRDELGGQAKVVVMAFDDLPDVQARADGMIAGLLEGAPEAEIVARVRGATTDWGKESIQQLLADGVEFNVILSINDAGAFGALAALEEAGIAYDAVNIAGVDAEILAQRYIREGKYFRVTVEAGRTVYASAAVDVIIKLLAGASVPEFIYIQPGELFTRESLGEAP